MIAEHRRIGCFSLWGAVLSTALVLMTTAIGAPALACSTPVYRYAMYSWQSAPYRVFYFHHGEPAQKDVAVNQWIEEQYDAVPGANIVLSEIDVTDEEQLDWLPKIVQKSYQENSDGEKPLHMVYSPWGVQQFVGRLEEETIGAIVDSPARKRIAELLHEGNATVMLILEGTDQEENTGAEKVIADVIASAKAGEIVTAADPGLGGMSTELLPEMETDETDSLEGAGEGEEDGLNVAVLKVLADDPKERWLVKSLMAVEPDLDEYAGKTMIFAVYGRGRAMPPYIGKGITVENLIECVAFLAGPCSCMVKDDNPGMDLLISWDWEETSNQWAAAETGAAMDPYGYQEFAADDSGSWTQTDAQGDAVDDATANAETDESGTGKSGDSVAGEYVAGSSLASERIGMADGTDDSPGTPSDDLQSTATEKVSDLGTPPAQPEATAEEAGPSTQAAEGVEAIARRQSLTIGLGLGAGTLLVLLVGFAFILRQRPT